MKQSNKNEKFISDFRFNSWLTPRPEDTGFKFTGQEKKKLIPKNRKHDQKWN